MHSPQVCLVGSPNERRSSPNLVAGNLHRLPLRVGLDDPQMLSQLDRVRRPSGRLESSKFLILCNLSHVSLPAPHIIALNLH